ncbi:MAG: hypothetical protein J2P50_03545 [Hyphomicrobiaceae bacterium]|nr:hypothetical protein [Hyphomicrobiaceae bacterium]
MLAAALVLAGALSAQAIAQRWDREWVLLGERQVNFRVDRDAINVGQSEDWWRDRGFRRLHLIAERSDIYLINLRLVYFNGYWEDFQVNQQIREGQDQPVDLRGDRKYLQRIEMIYRSRPSFEGRAVMKVYGEPARFGASPAQLPPIGARPGPGPAPGYGPEWSELGCQRVSLFGVDHDTVRVGRRDGRFKSIRLHVRGADINILDLKVVYGNGEPDHVPVRAVIRQGERTRPLELRGWERVINRVDMTYITIPNFKGQATVCVEGLQ